VLALIALALSVGIVDSINPSTIGPAVYLASTTHAARSLSLFTAGVFAVYATGGIALALGPGQALPTIISSTCSRSASAWAESCWQRCSG
jgi:hypothetical protein